MTQTDYPLMFNSSCAPPDTVPPDFVTPDPVKPLPLAINDCGPVKPGFELPYRFKDDWSFFNMKAGDCTAREYYAQFVDLKIADIIAKNIGDAVFKDDMETIPLRKWHVMSLAIPAATKEKMIEHGEIYKLDSGVALLKETAQQYKDGKWIITHDGKE